LQSIDRQELMKEGFAEMCSSPELQKELQRAKEVHARIGY
jgi:hypothetical protein